MLRPNGNIPLRITLDDFEATRRSFPAEVRADPRRETFTLAVSVVRHFFGHQWYIDHVFQDAERSRSDGFMRIDYTPGPIGERKTSRLLDFAENLFNLQHINGFDDRVNQMRAESMIESTYAEFDFARFLYIHEIDFKFVVPCGISGKDYDYRIRYADGREVCADAKCRLEGTEMRAETVMNALKKARSNNLPPDERGAVFVKVPSTWLEDETMRRRIAETVHSFLRNTQRVVSVVIYAVVTIELKERQMMLMRHRFQEFDNPRHRFDQSKGWLLFRDYEVPKEWGGMPPKWHRVFSQGFLFGEKAGVIQP
jgi:hypothetical protein